MTDASAMRAAGLAMVGRRVLDELLRCVEAGPELGLRIDHLYGVTEHGCSRLHTASSVCTAAAFGFLLGSGSSGRLSPATAAEQGTGDDRPPTKQCARAGIELRRQRVKVVRAAVHEHDAAIRQRQQ